MMLNAVDNQLIKSVTIHCSISLGTMFALLFYLMYFDRYHTVGEYTAMYLPGVIVAIELINTYISGLSSDGKDGKTMKKSYMKVKMKEIFKSFILILSSVFIFHIIAVLFGASLFDKCEKTLMLSILITSLAVVPSCLNLGAEQTLGLLFGKYTTSDPVSEMIVRCVQLTFLGTWLGAIPIPLDWERPWQKWPITCYLGALLGNLTSSIFTLIKLLPNIIKVYTGKSFKSNRSYNVRNKT